MQTNRLGGLWDDETKHQAGSIWDTNKLAPTIDTMTGGGREPHILEVKKLEKVLAIDEQNMLVRSETIGTLTTDGNSPKHNNRVAECKKLGNVGDIATQGRAVFDKENIAPTLIAGMSHGNTVPYITEEKAIKIRQATEQGYALCEIGGGSRLGISNEPNKTRKSNRKRKDMSNSDNGEYP